MNYSIGEICEVTDLDGTWYECEILGWDAVRGKYRIHVPTVLPPIDGGCWFSLEKYLRKKKPKGNPDDIDTKIPWFDDRCVWKPEEIKTVKQYEEM